MGRSDMLNSPLKACHNCRRRRLRCDRSYPQCYKCSTAGQECLGYGKLYRWTDNLAGDATAKEPLQPSPIADDDQSRPAKCPRGSDVVVENQLCAPWVLIDPLWQDMDNPYRRYLSYFSLRVCKDLVSNDLPDRNPFRSLLPLTRAHPLLQHIIVAASAAHMSSLARAVNPSPGGTAQVALTDALVAKHKALRLLRGVLTDIGSVGPEVVLAAVLFFINVELIESGKHGWRQHLDGAGQVMTFMQPDGAGDEVLRDYLMSDCFIYYILSSAFTSSTHAATSYFQSAQISSILERAAANSYLCCPPEILGTLLAAAQLSNSTGDSAFIAVSGAKLMGIAQSFDARTWASDIRSLPHFQLISVDSRMHAGSAHRLAACLYILQAIPATATLVGTSVEELEAEMFYHLSSIADEDSNFKATAWPTFIMGASATDPGRQAWVLDRLERVLKCCPWGFIRTAIDTLQVVWNWQDPANPETAPSRSWVQKLKDPDLNFLMV